MAQVRTWVGFDVHAAKVVAAIADSESGELAVRRLGGATEQVAEFCAVHISGRPSPLAQPLWPRSPARQRNERVPGGLGVEAGPARKKPTKSQKLQEFGMSFQEPP